MSANPRFYYRYFYHLLACLLFVLISACGGGSGGSSASTSGTVTAIDTTGGGTSTGDGGVGSSSGGDSGADGTAGDGAPIVGGLVTITDANGLRVTATTNFQGYYNANISGFKSPLIGNVTKGSRTLYTFSTKVASTNKTVTINITGITDKIVSDIAVLAGKDSARKITATDIVANANNIAGVIANVNNSIASILAANGLNPATFDPINTPFTTNHKGYDAVLDALLITNGPAAPTRITPLTPLEATQQLFKSLRDTAGAYSNTANTGELDTAGNKLEAAINDGTLSVDGDTLAILGRFFKGVQLYDAYKSATANNLTEFSSPSVFGKLATFNRTGAAVGNSLLSEYGCEVALVTTQITAGGDLDLNNYRFAGSFYSTPSTTTTVVPPANVNAFSCFSYGVTGTLFGTALDDGARRARYITFIPQTNGTYKYIDQTLKGPFDRTNLYPDPVTGFLSVREGSAKFGTITATKGTNNQYNSFVALGQLTPGIKMLKIRTVAERAKYAHHTINLNFSNAVNATTETLSLSGVTSLIKNDGTVAADMLITSGSVLSSKSDLVKTYTASTPNQSSCPIGAGRSQFGVSPNLTCVNSLATTTFSAISAMNLGVSISVPNAKFEGTISAGTATRDVTALDSSYQPTDIAFNGKLYESDGAGGYRLFLNGIIQVINTNYSLVNSNFTNASNFPKRNTNFDGKLYLKDRPTMSLVLSYKNDSFTTNSMTGNFTWDGGWYFDIVANNNTANNTGSITFSSVSGVSFTLPRNSGAIAQPIYKGGTLMGNFTLNTKRINYIDGSFEQF